MHCTGRTAPGHRPSTCPSTSAAGALGTLSFFFRPCCLPCLCRQYSLLPFWQGSDADAAQRWAATVQGLDNLLDSSFFIDGPRFSLADVVIFAALTRPQKLVRGQRVTLPVHCHC